MQLLVQIPVVTRSLSMLRNHKKQTHNVSITNAKKICTANGKSIIAKYLDNLQRKETIKGQFLFHISDGLPFQKTQLDCGLVQKFILLLFASSAYSVPWLSIYVQHEYIFCWLGHCLDFGLLVLCSHTARNYTATYITVCIISVMIKYCRWSYKLLYGIFQVLYKPHIKNACGNDI